MSTRGRKAELKAIDGGLNGVPAPTPHLPRDIVPEWNAVCADLIERKLLTTPALGLLETYLIARWTVQEAQKAVAEHGIMVKGAHQAPKANPACGVLSKALESVARLGAELGISPAARSKGQFQPKGGPSNGAPPGLDI